MKVLVTSGGTTEFIDDVRVLTNISTGKLGAKIVEHLINGGHQVSYIHAKNAALPNIMGHTDKIISVKSVTDVASLMEVMKEQVPKHDVIIHAMAVSDFGFRRDGAVKLKSNDTQAFVDYIQANIQKNPKVISYIKTWNPKCKLIGFKFEVGKSFSELADIALESMLRNNCDVVIANDKEEMQREKSHIAYWLDYDAYVKRQTRFLDVNTIRMSGKEEIAQRLVNYVSSL